MKKTLIIANRSLPMDYGQGDLPVRIHIVPRGELVNNEAGITQVLDDKALKSILADLQTNKAQNGGLYMGEEHFIYNSERSSEAFAWGKEFGLDDKGIWTTKYDATDVGEPALKNKRFKWTSFAADPAQPGAVENLGQGRVRILKIDTVGFTNFPNGKSLLDPMSNRAATADGCCPDCGTKLKPVPGGDEMNCPDCKKNFAVSGEPADSTANNKLKNKKMKTVCSLLGLSADADETSVHAAVAKLLNRPDVTAEAFTILKNSADRTTTLETENQTLLGEQCEAMLDGVGIKSDDKRRPHLVNSLKVLKNRDDRLAHLLDFGFKPVEAKATTPARVLNRGGNGNQQPAADAAGNEQERCGKIKTGLTMIKNRDKCSTDVAMATLRSEKPELFPAAE